MSTIAGSQAVRTVVCGARLLSSKLSRFSASKRAIHAVMVGRETCKNRLIRRFLQPCAERVMTSMRAWERSA